MAMNTPNVAAKQTFAKTMSSFASNEVWSVAKTIFFEAKTTFFVAKTLFFEAKTTFFEAKVCLAATVLSIHQDRSRNMWFGTSYGA